MSEQYKRRSALNTLIDRPRYLPMRFAAWGLLASAQVASIMGLTDGLRGKAPEPLDFFNHVGNTGSMTCGVIGAGVGAACIERLTSNSIMARRIAAGLSMTAIAVGNTLAETRLGASLPSGWGMQGAYDMVDLAYGMAAGAIGVSTGLVILDEVK